MWFFRLIAGIVLAGLVIGLAGSVFQAGFAAGAAGAAGPAAYPWYGWGWGFGGFSILGTLFTLFLVFALVRLAFGGGHRRHAGPNAEHGWARHGWGPGGPDDRGGFSAWEGRAREVHDEWHRKSDARGTSDPTFSAQTDAPARGADGGSAGPRGEPA